MTHVPTEAQRTIARDNSRLRLGQEDIARLVGVSLSTLRKYYWRELAAGRATSGQTVAEVIYRQAASNDHPNQSWRWAQAHLGWGTQKTLDAEGGTTAVFINTGIHRDDENQEPVSLTIDGEVERTVDVDAPANEDEPVGARR